MGWLPRNTGAGRLESSSWALEGVRLPPWGWSQPGDLGCLIPGGTIPRVHQEELRHVEIGGGWQGEGPERNDGAVLMGTYQPVLMGTYHRASQSGGGWRELDLEFRPHLSHLFFGHLGTFLWSF